MVTYAGCNVCITNISELKQCMSKAGEGGQDLTVTSPFTALNLKGNTQNKQTKTYFQCVQTCQDNFHSGNLFPYWFNLIHWYLYNKICYTL